MTIDQLKLQAESLSGILTNFDWTAFIAFLQQYGPGEVQFASQLAAAIASKNILGVIALLQSAGPQQLQIFWQFITLFQGHSPAPSAPAA